MVIWKFKAITSVNPDPYYEVQQYILFFFQQVFKLSSRNQSTAIWWSMLVVYLLFFDKPEMETVTLKYWRSIYHEKWNINQYSIGTNWKGWLAIAKLKPLSLFISPLSMHTKCQKREMKSESDFSLAITPSPLWWFGRLRLLYQSLLTHITKFNSLYCFFSQPIFKLSSRNQNMKIRLVVNACCLFTFFDKLSTGTCRCVHFWVGSLNIPARSI